MTILLLIIEEYEERKMKTAGKLKTIWLKTCKTWKYDDCEKLEGYSGESSE